MIPLKFFPLNKIWRLKRLPRPAGKHANYDSILDCVGAFDVETSLHEYEGEPYSLPYLCQFAFEAPGVPLTAYYCRTLDEAYTFFERLANKVRYHSRIVIYVHNLSYEFTFLTGFYNFEPDEVFATGPHKILFCTMFDGRLELRDSYILSNMSLKRYLQSWDVEHQKLDGKDFDYTEERWPWTPLTSEQLRYGEHDVLGLVEAVTAQRKYDGDTWYTIPKTATGYVRRDAKQALALQYTAIQKLMPGYVIYTRLREAFRGGNTHANRFLVGDIIEDVEAFDRSSSYPDVLVNRLYPMTPFREAHYIRTEEDIEKYSRKALLLKVELADLELKDPAEAFPYISVSKVLNYDRHYAAALTADNGRLLSAPERITVLTLTDIDYRIIKAQYKWSELRVVEAYTSRYMRLPEAFTELVLKYYRLKTELKNVPGREADYRIAKARLNSLYGMCVQQGDKARLLYDYITGSFMTDDKASPEAALEKYERKAILPYQIGVWCTAYAREALQDMIDAFKTETGSWVAYCDTDSVYVLKGHGVDIDDINRPIQATSKRSGAYATDPKGITHYMGVWEVDHAELSHFKALGAKKYAYVENDTTHITISGVNKADGAVELTLKGEKKGVNPLELLDDGFIFENAGKNIVKYVHLEEPIHTRVAGHTVTYRSCVVIEEGTYTVGLTAEYLELLRHPDLIRKVVVTNKLEALM